MQTIGKFNNKIKKQSYQIKVDNENLSSSDEKEDSFKHDIQETHNGDNQFINSKQNSLLEFEDLKK